MPASSENAVVVLAAEAAREVWEDEYRGLLSIPLPRFSAPATQGNGDEAGRYSITIDESARWQIVLEFGQSTLGEDELRRHLRVILRHEIGHYLVCPYDFLRHMRMLQSVLLVLKSAGHGRRTDLAARIVNEVSDIIVDTMNFRQHPRETIEDERYWYSLGLSKDQKASELSSTQRLMFAIKQALWGESIGCEVDERLIDSVETMRKAFAVVMEDSGPDQRASFPRLAAEYAKVWLALAQNEQGMPGLAPTLAGTPNPAMPHDASAIQSFAIECSIDDFSSVLDAAQISSKKEARRIWYEENAIEFGIPFQVPVANEALPAYPVKWKLGDSLEELDLTLSLQCSPLPIPGLTTLRWNRESAMSHGSMLNIPDLLVALDTSGSMVKEIAGLGAAPLHIARLAVFGILKSYEGIKAQTAGVNFSQQCNSSEWNSETTPLKELMLNEFGSGTTFPNQLIESMISTIPGRKALVVLTDSEIPNLTDALVTFTRILECGHMIMIYVIAAKTGAISKYEQFVAEGGRVQMVRTPDDLYSDIKESILTGSESVQVG